MLLSHETHQLLFVFMLFIAMPVSVYFAIRAVQDYKEERAMSMQDKKYINIYELSLGYGGPEEGGWWYEIGHLVESNPIPADLEGEPLFDLIDEYYEKWPNKGLRTSVLYPDDRGYDYGVYVEDHPGKNFPEYTPHYE